MGAYRLFPEFIVDRALYQLKLNLSNYEKATEEISTGLRIVRAKDDASDLMVSDWAKQFYSALTPAIRNIKKGLELLRTTDDALTQIYNIALKIKELVIEAAGKSEDERKTIQGQINELTRAIRAIIETTEFDGFNLLKGDYYIVHYGSEKNKYLIINANSSMEKSLYLVAKTETNETGTAILGFNNEGNQPVEGSGEGGDITPVHCDGLATWEKPCKIQLEDRDVILRAFYASWGDQYYWNIYIKRKPHGASSRHFSAPKSGEFDDGSYHFIYNADDKGNLFLKIINQTTGEVIKGTATYEKGGDFKKYPPGTDPKIYEYDSVDKKTYEVNLSSINAYPIQVASSEATLQDSITNIETYIAKLDIVRAYYGNIENKLLNIQMANLNLRDNMKEVENTVRGSDIASKYSELVMEKFKSQMTDFVIVQAFQIPQLVLRILR